MMKLVVALKMLKTGLRQDLTGFTGVVRQVSGTGVGFGLSSVDYLSSMSGHLAMLGSTNFNKTENTKKEF